MCGKCQKIPYFQKKRKYEKSPETVFSVYNITLVETKVGEKLDWFIKHRIEIRLHKKIIVLQTFR